MSKSRDPRKALAGQQWGKLEAVYEEEEEEEEDEELTPRASTFFNVSPDHFPPLSGKISMETASSSSIPMAAETEESQKVTAKSYKGKNIDTPIKKLTTRHDEITISESKSGDSSVNPNQNRQGRAKSAEEFKHKIFLFQLQLSPRDVVRDGGGLIIPKEQIDNHCPALSIAMRTDKLVTLVIFTDAQYVDWIMKIFFDVDSDAYMIIDGWEGFVEGHNLEAMDVIKFYRPVPPAHEMHFLVECVKREKTAAGTSQTDQLGGAKKDGNGGDCGNRGGDGGGGGGGGGRSDGGGSGGKWKTMCCWIPKNQHGGREKAVMILEEEEALLMTDSTWEEMIALK
ncbi:unnamed protein product [Camellia sinensis]